VLSVRCYYSSVIQFKCEMIVKFSNFNFRKIN